MSNAPSTSRLPSERRKPDFICIGASKAGTTWLYEQLRTDPHIWMPHVKELHYFDREEVPRYASLLLKRSVYGHVMRKALLEGIGQGRLSWALRYLFKARTMERYQDLFVEAGERLAGEVTPAYARMPAERIAQVAAHYPDLKIIYLLRNPVERIWSHLNMVRKRREGFDEADVPDLLVRINERHRESSDYLGNLDRWGKFFPAEQVHLAFYEELRDEPQAFLDRLYVFLGLETGQEGGRALVARQNEGVYAGFPERARAMLYTEWVEEIRAMHQRFDTVYTAQWLQEAEKYIKAKSL